MEFWYLNFGDDKRILKNEIFRFNVRYTDKFNTNFQF